MTPEQTQIIRANWQQVTPIADTAATLFYERLFEIDPAVKPLFAKTDMSAQRSRLLNAIALVIAGLEQVETLRPTLSDLGRRHVGYGVEDRHYDSVGAALLWTLKEGLGENWTTEAEAAWTEAFGLIAGAMRQGAEAETAPRLDA